MRPNFTPIVNYRQNCSLSLQFLTVDTKTKDSKLNGNRHFQNSLNLYNILIYEAHSKSNAQHFFNSFFSRRLLVIQYVDTSFRNKISLFHIMSIPFNCLMSPWN
jgi:hypothetical protein